MKVLKSFLVLFLALSINPLFGQTKTEIANVNLIKSIYTAVDTYDTQTIYAAMSPDMEWQQQKTNIISELFSDLDSPWEFVAIKDLNIIEIAENKVLAIGTLTGKYSKNTPLETQPFKHVWWIKDGKVINFLQ